VFFEGVVFGQVVFGAFVVVIAQKKFFLEVFLEFLGPFPGFVLLVYP
jgi:hypothetical protein